MNHTWTHSFKRNSPEEEYEKDNVGVDGSNVDYNGVFCDSFDDAKVDLEFVKEWVANSLLFFFQNLAYKPHFRQIHPSLSTT